MAIQQFYTPKKLLYPQNKFLATPPDHQHQSGHVLMLKVVVGQ